MFFKSKQLIGLDIGSNSIKLAVIENSGGKPVLDGFYFMPTPGGSVNSGEIISPPDVANALGSLIQQAETKKKGICASVWGGSVVVKRIQVPRMDVKLLEEQIKFEAEQYIPFNLSEVNLEFHVLKKQESTPDSMDVLLIAAKKDLIMSYAEAVEGAGLDLTTVDVSGFALSNCFEFNYPNPGANHIGILNIGFSACNFVVRHAGEVIFVRDIPFGGYHFTEEIRKNMGVSYEEAENLKFGAAGEDSPPEVNENLLNAMESFLEELNRTIDFYMTSSSMSTPIQRFYLSGGSSVLPGLKDYLENHMQVSMEVMNPFINIGFNPKNITPDYMKQIIPYASLAMGLGIRKKGDES
tara:strand:- start:1202 stop:2260 length:1059 start_codon:yes stop_codon:yes gene_type:complete